MVVFRNMAKAKVFYTDEMSIENIMRLMQHQEEVLGLTADTRRMYK